MLKKFFEIIQFHKVVTFYEGFINKGNATITGSISATSVSVSGNIIATGNIQGSTIMGSDLVITGGMKGIILSDTLTNPPTDAEFTTLLGTHNQGKFYFVLDTTANITYLVVDNGTSWEYVAFTSAV